MVVVVVVVIIGRSVGNIKTFIMIYVGKCNCCVFNLLHKNSYLHIMH